MNLQDCHPSIREELKQAVRLAAQRPDACAKVGELYERVQREIDHRQPVCVASGRCCRFETFGHRLYVTTLEIAAFCRSLQEDPGHPSIGSVLEPWDGTGCPFQQHKLCTVHPIRPFGCRIFFCDATATHWQNEQYERFHADLKRLHEEHEVPYFYVEWRVALRAIGEGESDR